MVKYLKLVRLPNLLMVPLTMYLLRYGVVEPMLTHFYNIQYQGHFTLQFPDNLFLIVCLINVFIGAAGYVINDYFDRKIDSINRGNKVLIGKSIGRRTAMILHLILNFIALALAAYLAYRLWKPSIFVLYLLIAGVFWLYSTTYKKQLLVANLIVALGTATIPLQVAFFEITALNRTFGMELIRKSGSFELLFYWLAAFAVFAFMTNLIREFVKDIEDYEGDQSFGRTTLPIYFGTTISKWIISILTLFTVGLLHYAYKHFIGDHLSKIYLGLGVALPLLGSLVLLILAKKAKHYRILSLCLKAIMFMGVCYAFLAKYIMPFIF